MKKLKTNTFSIINVHKKASLKSEIVTQLIFGQRFTILNKLNKWIKIRIQEDNYMGYIRERNYYPNLIPTHKINKLKATIYKFPSKKKKIGMLTFGSKIRKIEKNSSFLKFDKGWIKLKDIKPVIYKEKNIFRKIKIFKNTKYKWGGKSFKGIDCSALIQIFLNFNNNYCPRDTKDQFRYFKKNVKLNSIKKNDIIYWKGHVAVALSRKKLIHAYGPEKKTIIMDIDKTIKRIKKTANLKVLGVKRI